MRRNGPFRKAINSAFTSLPFWRALRTAKSLKEARKFAEAADAYRTALALRPLSTGTKVQLANMLKDSHQFVDAEATYLEALRDAPDNPDTHLQLGHLRKLMGRRTDAMACYRQALALNPNFAPARRELAAAGDTTEQLMVYEQQMREGGVESLAVIRSRLDEIASQINELRNSLPDAQAMVAFPVESYAEMRRLFEPPAPRTPGTASIGLVLCADRESLESLHEQLTALVNQSYPSWSLKVLGRDPQKRDIVMRTAAADGRITWVEVARGASLGEIERDTIAGFGAEWVLLMAKGAILHAQALAWVAAVARRGLCDAMVVDEEVGSLEPSSHDLRPVLRQSVDRDSLLDANIYGETIAVRSSVLSELLIDVRSTSSHALRSELLLKLVGVRPVAHLPLPLVRRASESAGELAQAADDHAELVRAYRRRAPAARVTAGDDDVMIGVVIPTKNNGIDASICVESLRALARRADKLEIVVIDNSDGSMPDPALAGLRASQLATVWKLNEPFNWSRFNNLAAARTQAPYLVFANDDMRMITPGWDDIVRSQLMRPDIGAVGARLLYPDDTIQHAGMLFNWRGSVIHDGLYRSMGDAGPSRRWCVTRSASAVTGAFLATRRVDFDAVGGFDEANLAVSYGDVDYCLRMRAAGLAVLWTPALTLYHYESKTRGLDHLHPAKAIRHLAEQRVIEKRWPGVLLTEPSVNPAWYPATLPFRLLRFPSEHDVWRHIELSSAINPWLLRKPAS